jgi:DNA-binding transcriptional LysR family regulator
LAISIELRHLRYFVAVAEELHFRRAAERLHMSQPPLSQQIRALEGELGVSLLRRNRRGVELTPAGQELLQEARDVLAGVDRAVRAAQRVDRGDVGILTVGFVGSAIYGRVPDLLRAFRDAHPDVEMQLRELTSNAQIAELRARRIDVGFLRPPIDAEGITVEVIQREPVVVALPADHPLAADDVGEIAIRQLRDESFVTLPRSEAPGLSDATLRTLARAGASPRVVQTVSELQTAVGLVSAGIGVALVPASLSALSRPNVVYRPLAGRPPQVDLAVTHRDGDDSPVVRAFLDLARRP